GRVRAFGRARSERSAPRLRLASGGRGGRPGPGGRRARRGRNGADRGGPLPAPGRAADVLVPATASRPRPGLRAPARSRPGAFHRGRHEPRASHPRNHARRGLRQPGLTGGGASDLTASVDHPQAVPAPAPTSRVSLAAGIILLVGLIVFGWAAPATLNVYKM